jgi:hypothetical protein
MNRISRLRNGGLVIAAILLSAIAAAHAQNAPQGVSPDNLCRNSNQPRRAVGFLPSAPPGEFRARRLCRFSVCPLPNRNIARAYGRIGIAGANCRLAVFLALKDCPALRRIFAPVKPCAMRSNRATALEL